ncbi:aspartate/glutamate racemase family protein [Geminicoccaceae bacterium 1502E]|nr:aspartate/glutamate racemase family protein [Geminicoccaceae bacterium 1502E]
MTRPLALWHSVDTNAAPFEGLVRQLAPEIPIIHRTRADLLAAAQPAGLTPAVRRAVAEDILAVADDGAAVVLCTCSTLGPGAESAAELTDATVLRVDRPMLEQALEHGPRIAVCAALASTIGPTRDLLLRVARERGVAAELREITVEDAFPLFQAGDRAGYARKIAQAVRNAAGGVDAVVLAQASMAGAIDLLADLSVPVLASPRLGAEAAVAAWRQVQAQVPARAAG